MKRGREETKRMGEKGERLVHREKKQNSASLTRWIWVCRFLRKGNASTQVLQHGLVADINVGL